MAQETASGAVLVSNKTLKTGLKSSQGVFHYHHRLHTKSSFLFLSQLNPDSSSFFLRSYSNCLKIIQTGIFPIWIHENSDLKSQRSHCLMKVMLKRKATNGSFIADALQRNLLVHEKKVLKMFVLRAPCYLGLLFIEVNTNWSG